MRLYELVMIFRPTLKEADRKKQLATIKEWIKDLKVKKEDDWGQKALAYTIKKEDAGHFYMLQLEGENIPLDFEQRIIRQESVIRHLLLRTK